MGREIELYRPPHAGGQGARALAVPSREDIRLAGQAIRGRWPMSTTERRNTIQHLVYIASHPERFGAGKAVSAGKALIAADRVNLEDEARHTARPEITREGGRTRVRFESLTDDELDRFIEEAL